MQIEIRALMHFYMKYFVALLRINYTPVIC